MAPRGAPGRAAIALLAAATLAVVGCADRPPSAEQPAGAREGRGDTRPLDDAGTESPTGLTVRVEGDTLLLDAASTTVPLARFGEQDGEPVHVSIRPGDHDRTTVLALTRVDDGAVRYELRYLTVDGDPLGDPELLVATELYWFPFRQQVDEHAGEVLDVAPVPVWAPDGGSLAWIEWTSDGTRLRTVGWFDDGVSSNPSHETFAYRLADVPAGAQLEAWLDDAPSILIARGEGDARYRIEVERGAPA